MTHHGLHTLDLKKKIHKKQKIIQVGMMLITLNFDISSSNILDNVTKNLQENEGLRTSINGISSPVNIHVSVTINTNQQQSTCATSGTLSDLKKQRSLNRVQQQQQSYNKNSPIKEINQPLALKSNNNLNLVSNNLNKDNLEDKNPASKRFSDSEEVVGERSSSFLSSCCMIS
ncbi:unnamed protein product [Lepeophtheirus salmonis]|uniref:(salmon louse) hypothetical protein n=1 Tax=Lepeophtheirus salmonis TaxID=72036 RepID=A0A7R8H9F7_LEPSM|nr:unnamed protein product [Lepeophtheirus salmonis]CAF2954448.1 unnamed protein product [Lepeophtheirus salmonis]